MSADERRAKRSAQKKAWADANREKARKSIRESQARRRASLPELREQERVYGRARYRALVARGVVVHRLREPRTVSAHLRALRWKSAWRSSNGYLSSGLWEELSVALEVAHLRRRERMADLDSRSPVADRWLKSAEAARL